MAGKRRFGIGTAGIGVALICAAASALDTPRPIWIVMGIAGLFALIYAVFVGDPDAGPSASAEGGGGDGDFRGNVISGSTINFQTAKQGAVAPQKRDMLNVEPDVLMGFFRHHTKVQADKLLEPYLGGWIELSCWVKDVSESPEDESRFTVYSSLNRNTLESASLEFTDKVQNRLPRLRIDDEIKVVGRICSARAYGLNLDECEFVE